VGGSGIDMSATIDSLATYLDLENRQATNDWKPFFYDDKKQDGFVDPLGSDNMWESMVATNPIFAWFMAGETEMTAREFIHYGYFSFPCLFLFLNLRWALILFHLFATVSYRRLRKRRLARD